MTTNWKVVKTASFVIIAFTIAGLLGFGFTLEDKVFNVLSWKTILLLGQGYLAWSFKSLLNF